MYPPSDRPAMIARPTPASVEHRGHVVNGRFVRIERRIVGRVGAVVAAHVPRDHVVAVRQLLRLTLPHSRAGAVAMREQNGWPGAMLLVVDAHAIAIEIRHSQLILARLVIQTARRNEMSTSEIVGSIGVALLLIAFFMNSFAMIDSRSL